MDKIKRLEKRILSMFENDSSDIYKDKILELVRIRDIKKLKESLQELECINPNEVVSFLQDVLDQTEHNNKLHNQRIDMLEGIKGTVDTLIENYQRDFFVDDKSYGIKVDKLDDVRKNCNMLEPYLSEHKQKVHKNEQIQDILYQALYKFLECKNPYPEILSQIFKTVIKRDYEELREIIDSMDDYKEYNGYVVEQIRNSYTVTNLKNEIKALKVDTQKPESSKKNKRLLKMDIKLWDLLKGIEKNEKPHEIEKSDDRLEEIDIVIL